MSAEYPKPNIEAEVSERKETEAFLATLPGYQALTADQQQMIRLSLAVQQRAERGSDEASARQIGEPRDGVSWMEFRANGNFDEWVDEQGEKLPRTYSRSQNHVYQWFCSAVVSALEKAEPIKLESGSAEVLDRTFFEGFEYHDNIETEADLETFIELEVNPAEMPLVLDVAGAQFSGLHNALLLGRDQEGNVVVWEKIGFSKPYRLTTLKQIFAEYGPGLNWGVRPLRTGDGA